ncbi:MAG: hypothetical protein IJS08_08175 [Victivallales bacterium]|nr:hypothetical protein [Victivallales bacterium]
MLNFGIVGMNPGNGHPYSFTAVFNGFNPDALEQCDFPIIRQYLVQHHRNQQFIQNARVTHVWTQDRSLSEKIAAVSRIPNVVDSLAQLADETDAIIFARDDIWNHFEMARSLFRTGKPIYMDKLLCATQEELKIWSQEIPADYPLMTASSFRFAPIVKDAVAAVKARRPMAVHGVSPCVWIRYAPHLLDPLFEICGRDVASVQNSGSDKHDIVTLTFADGLMAVLEVHEGISLPMGLKLRFSAPEQAIDVPYTDPTLESYFLSIVEMMRQFTRMVEFGEYPVSRSETLFMNRVVLAALASREQGGRKILLSEFLPEII